MSATRRRVGLSTTAALSVAGLAYALQQTLVLPALPTLQRDLHTSTEWVSWTVSVFLLSSCAAAPVMGRLGDQFGKKRVLELVLALFLLGSILCSLSTSIWMLIAARALQGLGGSIVAIGGAILRDEYPRERVGLMIGIFISAVSAGTFSGTMVSGLVIDHLPWRMLFVLGAAPIAASLVLVRLGVRKSPPVAQARLDIRGAVLLVASLVSLLLVLTEGNAWGWGSARLLGLAAGCLVLFAVWARTELRAGEPMLDLHMLVRRPILIANCCVLFSTGSIFGLLTLVPRFAQTKPELAGYGFGLSVTIASLIFLPGFVVGFAAGPVGGAVGARTGTKWPLAVASFMIAVGAALAATWHAHPWQLVIGTFVALATWPAVTVAGMTVILKVVRPVETGVASGMNLVFRQVGGAVGVQMTAAILSSTYVAGTMLPSEGAFVGAFALVALSAFVAALLAPLIAAGRSAPIAAAEAAA